MSWKIYCIIIKHKKMNNDNLVEKINKLLNQINNEINLRYNLLINKYSYNRHFSFDPNFLKEYYKIRNLKKQLEIWKKIKLQIKD